MNNRPHRFWVLLTLIVAASFAVRVAALAYWRTGAIESEGAEYARIAENLRNGVGYVGIVSPGPQLVFPPLFPLLIAGASLVTRNYEWAGRLVSLVLGTLLPLPVFGIASRLFNRRVGFVAAILTLLHPLLINLSFSVLSEGPYATFLLSAVYVVVRALNHSSIRLWLLVGGAFGLACLLRQEAVAALLIAVLFALTATEGGPAIKCKRAFAAILVFSALALPEVVFIYRSTGKVRLEGKSTQLFALGKRILAAEANPELDHQSADGQRDEPSSAPSVASWEPWEVKWAFYAIDAHLRETGIAMRSHTEVVRETQITLKDLFHLVGKGVLQNAPKLPKRLSESWFGAPFLPALALLGALRRPWRRPQASSRLFVMLVAAASVVATFSALWTEARYYFVLVPLLSIWAANGLVEVGLWTKVSSAAVGWVVPARPVVSECIIPGMIGLAVIIYPVKGVRQNYIFADGSPSSRVEKEVGLWVGHQQNRRVRIMDNSIPLVFHADAQWVHFPYCSAELALRFLDAAQVDYIVLRREETFTQYYEEWLNRGIPDRRAELLHVSSGGDAKFVVYRWHRDVTFPSVTLSWQAPPPVPGVKVVGYNVYRSTTSGAQYARIATRVPAWQYEDRLVNSGRTYFYVVTALDQTGRESNFSGEVKAQVPYGTTGNHVAWTPPGVNGNPWPQGNHRTYTTNFPIAENPISEGGIFTDAKTDGVDWSDVRTTKGLAFGTQVPPTGPPYNDSVALLKGTWNPDQLVTATVHTVNQQGGSTFEEVELWLRGSISPHFTTGYEINFRCLTGPDTYVQFGYWEGPLNKFGGLGSTTGPGLHDGDVVAASIVGNTITIWINGVQVLQGKDPLNRSKTGNPGMGFYYQGSTGSDSDYGFTNFTASDESQSPLAPTLSLAVH